jgi:hypothetical protein
MTLAMVAVGVLVGVFGAAAPASASNYAELRDNQTGLCLNSNGKVSARTCNGSDFQGWDLLSGGRFQNLDSNYCLDSNWNREVYTLPCNGGPFQSWYFVSGSRIINYATGYCLDSNYNGDVYMLSCNGGNFQNWTAALY